MRQRYCRVCGGWHELDRWPHNCMPEVAGAPSDKLPVPMFISDTMDATEHPCDGKRYDSKVQFRRVTKAHGCVEIGNDPGRFRKLQKQTIDRSAVRDSIQKAKARVARGERVGPQ
jgi:hypothetical protein